MASRTSRRRAGSARHLRGSVRCALRKWIGLTSTRAGETCDAGRHAAAAMSFEAISVLTPKWPGAPTPPAGPPEGPPGLEAAVQGLPSLTKTGTATLRGLKAAAAAAAAAACAAAADPKISKPFSEMAFLVL